MAVFSTTLVEIAEDEFISRCHAQSRLQAPNTVATDHVRYLVSQHRGKLRLVIHLPNQTCVEIDEAAGGGEGIDLVGINYGEMVLNVFAIADRHNPLPYFVDVILPDRVGQYIFGTVDMPGHSRPNRYFLASRDENDRLLATRTGSGASDQQ